MLQASYDSFQNCYRVSDYYVPDEDVSTGEYDFDQLDLRALAKDDKKVCN